MSHFFSGMCCMARVVVFGFQSLLETNTTTEQASAARQYGLINVNNEEYKHEVSTYNY